MVADTRQANTAEDAALVRCPRCGAINRVPAAKLAQGLTPICGRCKQPLPAPPAARADGAPHDVTDATFAADVEQSPIPVLVDCWAPWCGPCRFIAPAIDQLAAEFAGAARIAKLNIDDNPATATRFNVQSIPTLLIFKHGREVDRIIGVQPREAIAQRLRPHTDLTT